MNGVRIICWLGPSTLGLAIGCCGCATKQADLAVSPPPSQALRSQFGRMGVVESLASPRIYYFPLPKGKGAAAATGAMKGFSLGLDMMPTGPAQEGMAGLSVIAAAAVSVVGTTIGAINGALSGVPRSERFEAELVLDRAATELKVQESVRDCFLEAARNHARYPVTPLITDAKFSNRQSPTPQAVDTVIHLEAGNLLLTGKEAFNPSLKLSVTVRVRLCSATNDATLYSCTIIHTSTSAHKFTAWADDDARILRQEFLRTSQQLADKIVDKLFSENSR